MTSKHEIRSVDEHGDTVDESISINGVVNNPDGSISATNISGDDDSSSMVPRRIVSVTGSATVAAGGTETVFTHNGGPGVLYGLHHSQASQPFQKRIYVDGSSDPVFQYHSLDGMAWNGDQAYEKIGAENGYDYIWTTRTPIGYEDSFKYEAHSTASNQHTVYGFSWGHDDIASAYGSVGRLETRGDGNKDTGAPTGETTIVDTGAGVKGAFQYAFIELFGAGGQDFELRVYFDGESTPSIQIDYPFMWNLFQGVAHSGTSFMGVADQDDTNSAYGFYLNPGAWGLYGFFADRMEVTVVNDSGSGGDYDWDVGWVEDLG